MNAILATTYFGPVQWYQKLHRYRHVWMERCESFIKQTYRNRCVIAAAHGPQTLSIPIVHGATLTRDIRISDHGEWRHLHWNAIRSAYGESPFFEYYQDDIRPFFEKRWDYLLDFNEAIREKMCELLDFQPKVTFSSTYLHPVEYSLTSHLLPLTSDFREAIRPKHPLPDADFEPKPYYQVYQQKHGFLPNLSILDLLFNMGPEGIFYL